MSEIINIYCDESCHLENDYQKIMVLGAVWCPLERTKPLAIAIRQLKSQHGLPPDFEVKWTKVSKGGLAFYNDLLEFFFKERPLHFRALIVPDKSLLRHEHFQQDHDTWYYKMYFDTLKVIIDPHKRYRIYLDIKDTCGEEKRKKLNEVINRSHFDFSRKIIERVQPVRSEEVEQIQLADFLIGIVSYANRGLTTNSGKVALVDKMKKLSHYSLTKSTLFSEKKVNIFHWQPREISE